ncbi:asparaginase domain-containing protein [Blastococcus sp. SYSU D00669]
MTALPRIALVGTGGTISGWSPDPLDLTGYTEPGARRLTLAEVLAAVPEAGAVADVVAVPGPAGPSHGFGLPDLLGIADLVRSVRDGADGVVVTCGTNALEELAFLLSLVLEPGPPVVVTGAMRPLSALSGDGPLHLVDALRVAGSPAAAGRGVLVAVDGRIWPGRWVTKARTNGLGAFAAGERGPCGAVEPDGAIVFFSREDAAGALLPVTAADAVPRVDVVLSYAGADGVPIEAAVAAGAAGLVSAGTGAGFATPAEHAALVRAVGAGVVVVQSARGSGRVHPRPELVRDGIVAAQYLGPVAARVLLALALACGADARRVQSLVDAVAGG